MEYNFSLDNSKPNRLFSCPDCEKRTFKRYWDNFKNEYFPDEDVGRCNREFSCGCHNTPKQFFEKNGLDYQKNEAPKSRLPKPKPPTTYIDYSWVEKSMNRNIPNYFTDYLKRLFGEEKTNILINKFRIGDSKHWKGATVFWQIDQEYKVRTGKIMLYNSTIGKRVTDYDNWVHSVSEIQNFTIEQCFFGLHQLTEDSKKSIGIVESQKTAIILTAIDPKITWLASGGIALPLDRFKPLKGRKIILYPDAGIDKNGQGTPFKKWTDKAETLNLAGFDISVSKLVENAATEEQRKDGYDLADYFTMIDQNGLSILNTKQLNK
ncbi:DUF6371 domain-containing protein [Arcicella sp. LKC2W]|uniref:DUF6371 domain-containing protein n=1 Tax=Arcicella sp. LKC2W TaxID=2984198 RepID=UPI002B1FE9D7|nr:DUF6371 domain-containing protein [Arcicella sp. LKC2W]MEA5459858.1 DUF6371 domain-containing protein [Arcicella sp. LKC2W]